MMILNNAMWLSQITYVTKERHLLLKNKSKDNKDYPLHLADKQRQMRKEQLNRCSPLFFIAEACFVLPDKHHQHSYRLR